MHDRAGVASAGSGEEGAIRLGIHLPQYGREVTAREIVSTARDAESAGADDIWVSDHVIASRDSPRPPVLFHDALTVLTWAAASTERIGLGTSVLVGPYRNPVILARATATLDALSGGRLILGIGSGWQEREFDALGVPYPERGARTDEAIAVCRALWAGQTSFDGRFTAYRDMAVEPGPAQVGGPPVWIGGVSTAAAARAARVGDAWHLTVSDLAELASQLELLDAALDGVGRSRGDILISARLRMDPLTIAAWAPELEGLGVGHLLADLSRSAPAEVAGQIDMLRARTA